MRVRIVCEAENWRRSSLPRLARAGIGIVPDTAGGGGDGSMHDKFIVRDGDAVLTGSFNFVPSRATGNKNSILVVTGAADLAAIYAAEFDQMFTEHLFGRRKRPQADTQAFVDGRLVEVFFSPRNGATGRLVEAIRTCDRNLHFAASVIH